MLLAYSVQNLNQNHEQFLRFTKESNCVEYFAVTTTRDAKVALEILRKNKENFDIVITDVVRDDIDGFKLLEAIGLEMDIPVISKFFEWNNRILILCVVEHIT